MWSVTSSGFARIQGFPCTNVLFSLAFNAKVARKLTLGNAKIKVRAIRLMGGNNE